MLKNVFATLGAFLALLVNVYGQAPCAFDQTLGMHRNAVGSAESAIRAAVGKLELANSSENHIAGLKVIPVVVHVIHTGGSDNISDAQIQSQITTLNQDFRRMIGTPGYGNGVDAQVEFCLAKKDPLGRCTNGIVRINSLLANHQTYQRSLLKQLSFWDNTRYLNIYVVKNISNGSGTLGYASFPGGPPDEDGIVVRNDYFGTTGTAVNGLGRTTTHEAGHWLGLYHTFHNGCGTDTCADGDGVCDTPPVALPNYGCPMSANTCTNDNQPDQVQNYMDYSNDACKSIFTEGQRDRMHASLDSLRTIIWSPTNLVATGCDSGFVNGPCNVIADFTALTTALCTGASITFYNRSQNNPLTFSWSFPGGSPASSSLPNPVVAYNTNGVFPVKLVVTNAIGSESLLLNNYISVSPAPIGQALPFYEGFESPVFPPSGITIENADTGVTWERDTVAKALEGNASAKINNLINTNYGQSDALVLPSFDFTTISGTPRLFFNWAYARSDPSYSDELIVLASRDCGVTWSQVFYRTGASLVTGPTQTTPYIPDSSTVWKSANISLAAYSNDRNVRLKIVNVTDGGNNLYVDRLSVGLTATGIDATMAGPIADVKVYPNPARGEVFISAPPGVKLEEIRLTNQIGQEVPINATMRPNPSLLKLSLPSGLTAGVYYLKVKRAAGTTMHKLSVN